MKIRKGASKQEVELPIQFSVSFGKVFSMIESYANDDSKDHPFHVSAKKMVAEIEKTPELITGITDLTLLDNYKDQIELILTPLFPDALMNNEIKSASVPFSFTSFMFTSRFEQILQDAGEDFDAMPRNLEPDMFYIHACTMILAMCHGYFLDLKRPFFFDIPDKNGDIKNYRVAFNADMAEIIPHENAPEITEEDYKLLLDNFENIDLWREKFPPNSYTFKGFGIMNLFDVTVDETISDISTNLLRSDDDLLPDLQKNLSRFFNIKDLMLGYSGFEMIDSKNSLVKVKKSESLVLTSEQEIKCSDFFCEGLIDQIFNTYESVAISNVEKYVKVEFSSTVSESKKERVVIKAILPNSRKKLQSTIVPKGSILSNNLMMINVDDLSEDERLILVSLLNSSVIEYRFRYFLSNFRMTQVCLGQLPIDFKVISKLNTNSD